MSICKKIQYSILYNEKLDWLKRKNSYGDKIDVYLFLIPMIIFLLTMNIAPKWVFILILLFIPLAMIGTIRHIKSVPGDIESRLMGSGMCVQWIFFGVVWLIFLVTFLGRIF